MGNDKLEYKDKDIQISLTGFGEYFVQALKVLAGVPTPQSRPVTVIDVGPKPKRAPKRITKG